MSFHNTYIQFLTICGVIWAVSKGTELVLRPSLRKTVSIWLLRRDFRLDDNALARSVLYVFDTAFRTRRLGGMNLPKFWRSALLTVVFIGLLAVFAARNYGHLVYEIVSGSNDPNVYFLVHFGPILVDIVGIFAGGVLFNVLLDYVSLLETRWCLGKLADKVGAVRNLKWLLLDLVATTSLAFLALAGATIVSMIVRTGVYESINAVLEESGARILYEDSTDFGMILSQFGAAFDLTAIQPNVASIIVWSTYLTSIWIWLVFAGGAILRLTTFLEPFRSFTGRFLNVSEHPMQSIGWTLIAALTIIYLLLVSFL